MSAAERSVVDVFQDIASNVQDIVRSEVRLAKTEVREDISTAQPSALLLGIGIVSAIFALFFALLAIVYALSYVLLNWGAALLVALGLALCAGIVVATGVRRFKRINATRKTAKSLKENA
jgi:uncharacterized membrane protein YqjE